MSNEELHMDMGVLDLVLSIDQGTQSTRASLYNRQCRLVAYRQQSHEQKFPDVGWVSHNPEEILMVTKQCMMNCIQSIVERNIDVRVKAIGITNQRETVVAWDKVTGKSLCDAIVWYDTRTKEISERYAAMKDVDFTAITGLMVNTYFSAVKIRWMIENVKEVQDALKEKRCLFGTIDSWLIWNLTGGVEYGVHVTDVTNASRTLLMDLKELDWSDQLLELFEIPRDSLPSIASCAEIYGHTKDIGCALYEDVPISGCAGDQQASCIGHGMTDKGSIKCTFGTGGFVLVNCGEEPVVPTKGLLSTLLFKLGKNAPTYYALEGSVATVGSGLEWLKSQMGLLKSIAEADDVLKNTPDTGDVYFVPAFSGLFAPYWREDARGCIVGMSASTTSKHVVRALCESIGFTLREVTELMTSQLDIKIDDIRMRIDGGVTKSVPLIQLFTDLCGCCMEVPENQEATSLGAALAAGIGAGVWDSIYHPAIMLETKQVFRKWKSRSTPEMRAKRYERYRQAVSRSLNWV